MCWTKKEPAASHKEPRAFRHRMILRPRVAAYPLYKPVLTLGLGHTEQGNMPVLFYGHGNRSENWNLSVSVSIFLSCFSCPF